MYNQDEVAAAMIMYGHPEAGNQKRGAVMLIRLLGATYFADEHNEVWARQGPRTVTQVAIQGRTYNVLPINNLPLSSADMPWSFDVDTLRFMFIVPDEPAENPRSGQLAVEYRQRGALVREFVSLDVLPASVLMNIVERLMALAPDDYKEKYDKLLGTMTQVGDAYGRMFG